MPLCSGDLTVNSPRALRRRQPRRGPHRAMRSVPVSVRRVLAGVALAALFTGALASIQGWVASAWTGQFAWWMHQLDIPLTGGTRLDDTHTLWLLPVAHFELPLRVVAAWAPWAHALVSLAVWWGAGRLPDAARPAMYLLRFAVLLHGCAIVYFLLWPGSFQYSVFQHTSGGFRQMWALMLLVPWLHLLIYYPLPYSFQNRVLLTLATLVYLGILTPLLYAVHAALIHVLGLIVMPLLELLFGGMLAIIGAVALYGWAMSWTPLPQEQA